MSESIDDYADRMEADAADARAEINRHHELIARLSEGLEWALPIVDAWVLDIGPESDMTRIGARLHYNELYRLLRREVG